MLVASSYAPDMSKVRRTPSVKNRSPTTARASANGLMRIAPRLAEDGTEQRLRNRYERRGIDWPESTYELEPFESVAFPESWADTYRVEGYSERLVEERNEWLARKCNRLNSDPQPRVNNNRRLGTGTAARLLYHSYGGARYDRDPFGVVGVFLPWELPMLGGWVAMGVGLGTDVSVDLSYAPSVGRLFSGFGGVRARRGEADLELGIQVRYLMAGLRLGLASELMDHGVLEDPRVTAQLAFGPWRRR
jgi:hypothetical protein